MDTSTRVTVDQLFKMTQKELDKLFSDSNCGPIPDGESKGTAIILPGTIFTKEIAELINVFAWQGKTFDAKKGVLINRILPFGLNAILAEVYKGPSWLDDKECIIVDYSKTSHLARWARDEIRQIQPNFYLGKMYLDKTPVLDLCLQFPA
jgi:hypothetical protein